MLRAHMKPLLLFALLLGLAAAPLPAAETLPLAGTWRFALDRTDAGTNESWFAKNLPEKIQLPGILEAQDYGDEISAHTPWVLSLYDHFWYLRADYAAATNAGRVKVPFICQPQRHYLGAAWYQRDIEIPPSWQDQHIVLFLERPHWKSTVWLDEQEIGSEMSLCTPHEFTLGRVTPGRHRLTVRVDNRMILPYRPDAHSVSDSLDDAWNGIVGKMELRATPPVWIDEMQVFPKPNLTSARVHFQIGNQTGKPLTAQLELTDTFLESLATKGHWTRTNFQVSVGVTGSSFETEFALPSQVEAWDEFHPHLQMFSTVLNAGGATNAQSQLIGLRDFHADGTRFFLNDRPLYFRGTHFGGDFPLTGYPPTDVESWKKMFQTCKNYGLNHMRFHSWCPPDAAFTAADELGFYLHVECGMWNEFSPGGAMEKMLYAETERIIKAYGNHPSFLLLSASNEAHGRWTQVLPQWVEHFRTVDPRRLYTPDTGWAQIQEPGHVTGADFLVGSSIAKGRQRNVTGWFGADFGESLRGIDVPVIAHELGQWCAYPDFAFLKKFTGFVQPGNFEIFRDSAATHGVLAQNHEFAQASGRLQLQCYKEEIEANLRTPGLAGFQLLDLHDYSGQGTALVGLLDPFWESKGYVTPAEFKKYCNPVVPLARLKQRVFTPADKFEVPVEVANFGPAPLTNAQMTWSIQNVAGKILEQKAFAPKAIPLGKSFPLETIVADLSNLPAPAQYKLVATIGPQPLKSIGSLPPVFQNDWNFWLFPTPNSEATPTDVLLTSSRPDAAKALAEGKKVLFTPRLADLSWWSPPMARVPVFWNALMGPTWARFLGLWCDTNSPALAEFPTEANYDWQWTELVRNARAVNLDRLPRGLKPIVSAIDDWNRNYKLGVIFEARVGSGKLLVSTADLHVAPTGLQLRRSLLDYLAGEHFQPTTQISPAEFASLFFDNRVMQKLGATASADGQPAPEILDGDPNTFWSSADARGKGPALPHEIQIHFPQPVAMNGLLLMPRQNQREHQGDIREFTLASSDDGTNWQVRAQGQLASTWDPQTIALEKTITAKHIKLTARSGFGPDQSTALGELAVLYAGPQLPENTEPMEYHHVRTASTDIDADDAPTKRKAKKH